MPVSIKPPPPTREKSFVRPGSKGGKVRQANRPKSGRAGKSGGLPDVLPSYSEQKLVNNERLSIEVRRFDGRVDVTLRETDRRHGRIDFGNGADGRALEVHEAEEISRLKMMCTDYATQMRMMAASHERDLNAYKLKVQAQYEEASKKFRQDSAIIANERQKIFELQLTNKYGETRVENEKLKLELTQAKQMVKKIADDLQLQHEIELTNRLAAQQRDFNRSKQESLKELKDKLNEEFSETKQKLTAHFEQQLTKLSKNYQSKNKPPDNHVSTQTEKDPKPATAPTKKPKSAKKRAKTPIIAKVQKPIETVPFDAKPNPLQRVVEVKEYQIQRLVGENAYLRDRLTKLTIELSDMKHRVSKIDSFDGSLVIKSDEKVLTQNYGYNNNMG